MLANELRRGKRGAGHIRCQFPCPSMAATILSNDAFENCIIPIPREPGQTIHTKLGQIQGFRHKLANGELAEIFLGIPFAKPPLGQLRFEKPEPPEPWNGVFKAMDFGPASIPVDFELFRTQPCSEDCLRLNIFRPLPSRHSIAPFPVFLYIHGGGFCSGSTREYGFQGWAENFLPEDIIVVTIQYRLGPFGFFTLGNGSGVPGNLGLWDMAMALRFVHENIAQFGGDPLRITVAGLSAGGAAAAAMAISPWTRDWVRASVEMSGTVLAEWTASEQTVAAGREFARRALGMMDIGEQIDENAGKAIKEQLKGLSVEGILQIVKQMGTTRPEPNLLVWSLRFDGYFLPMDFTQLVRNLPTPKPALMGLTEKEAIYFALQNKDTFLNPFGIAPNRMDCFGPKKFEHFVRTVVLGNPIRNHLRKTGELSAEKLEARIEKMTQYICNFYLGKLMMDEPSKNGSLNGNGTLASSAIDDDEKSIFLLDQYTRLISDLLFNVPLFWMAQHRLQCSHPTFLYFNRFFNAAQFEGCIPVKGATHGNEYPYMNGLFPVGEFNFSEEDKIHRRMLVQMLASFVKNGVPSVDGIHEWPSNIAERREEGLKFVAIGQENSKCSVEGICGDGIVELWQSCRFWMRFNQKNGFNLIRGIPNNNLS